MIWIRNPQKRQFKRSEGCEVGVVTDWNGSSGKTDVRAAPRYWIGKLTNNTTLLKINLKADT